MIPAKPVYEALVRIHIELHRLRDSRTLSRPITVGIGSMRETLLAGLCVALTLLHEGGLGGSSQGLTSLADGF